MSEEHGTIYAFYEIDCSETPTIRKIKEGFVPGGGFSVCHPNWPDHSFYVTVTSNWGMEVRGLNDTTVHRMVGGRWIAAAGEDLVAFEVKSGTVEARVVAMQASEALRYAWEEIRRNLEQSDIIDTMLRDGARGVRAMVKELLTEETTDLELPHNPLRGR